MGTTLANSSPAIGPAGPRGASARVLAFLPVIWALNLLDLLFTLLACQFGEFVELNPLAARLSGGGLVTFKLAMLLLTTAIFVRCRRHRLTEVGCYVLTTAYGCLAAVWFGAFGFLLTPPNFRQLLYGL